MYNHLAVVSLLVANVLSMTIPTQQQALQKQLNEPKKGDLIHELRRAEIIPTVLDPFTPTLTLSIFWENATAEVGNTVAVDRVQEMPDVQFIDVASTQGGVHGVRLKPGMQLTLALTDPDAPSRDDPEWSEICHWIATGVPLIKTLGGASGGYDPGSGSGFDSSGHDSPLSMRFSKDNMQQIMPYKPPGPPPKTGKHRYVFVALAPANGTTETLELEKPGDRRHWGFGEERVGLRKWAESLGLVVVGANFVYARNEVQ